MCSLARALAVLQVKAWGEGNVMIVTGSASGVVSRMRFRVPLDPGAQLDKIQVLLAHAC